MTAATSRLGRIRPIHYRSIFISSVHLGFSGCSAEYLLDFLRSTTCDYLYLVGDIIDIWQMKKKIHWPQSHNDVIRTILGKAKHGTRIIYVPGNHDELLRDYNNIILGNLEIRNEYVHVTKNGQRFLVLHGDQFDGFIKHSRILSLIGSSLYEMLLGLNQLVNFFRRKLGFSYWSLANVLKQKVKHAVKYISNFETAVAYAAKQHNVVTLSRGVNTELFKPGSKTFISCPRPVFLYMGRVSVEKNIEAFLRLDLAGSKVVVGDGPDLEKLKQQYPEAFFTGFKFGVELSQCVAAADVFVFPSLTDTFGIVLLEAMACGVPVAAYPVTGPIDVVRNGLTSVLDHDLTNDSSHLSTTYRIRDSSKW